MTEKSKMYEKMSSTTKQQPTMKLFAAWEVDRTPPNCVPRYVLLIGSVEVFKKLKKISTIHRNCKKKEIHTKKIEFF